jgi:hypothetical protein
VHIDKQMILDLLRQQGNGQQADQAAAELPDKIDTEEHADLLQKFGLDPKELLSKFGGGGALGGLLGG